MLNLDASSVCRPPDALPEPAEVALSLAPVAQGVAASAGLSASQAGNVGLMRALVVVGVEIAIQDAAGAGVGGGVVVAPGAEKHPASKHNIGQYLNGMNDVVVILQKVLPIGPLSMSIALDVHTGYDTVFFRFAELFKTRPIWGPMFFRNHRPYAPDLYFLTPLRLKGYMCPAGGRGGCFCRRRPCCPCCHSSGQGLGE